MELHLLFFAFRIFVVYFSFGLIVESTVGWIYATVRRIGWTKIVLAILVGNCVTYPLAFAYAFVFGLTRVEYLFVEFVVILVEAGFIRCIGRVRNVDAMVVSAFANTSSALGSWVLAMI
jgi:hypothetical protein